MLNTGNIAQTAVEGGQSVASSGLMRAHATLDKYIATRINNLEKRGYWNPTELRKQWEDLQKFSQIAVGGRATCGQSVDMTWVTLGMWNEIINNAKRLGFAIEVTPIKHDNGYATIKRGFWQSSLYKLAAPNFLGVQHAK